MFDSHEPSDTDQTSWIKWSPDGEHATLTASDEVRLVEYRKCIMLKEDSLDKSKNAC